MIHLKSLMPSFMLLLFVTSDFSATPWTTACHAPLPMGFLSQDYWSGFNFLSQGVSPRIETKSPAWQADSLPLSQQGSPPSSSQQISTESFSGNDSDSGAVIVIKRQNVCPFGA